MVKMFIRKYYFTLVFLLSAYLAGAQDVSQYKQQGLFQHFTEFGSSSAALKSSAAVTSPQSVVDFVKANFQANANYGVQILNQDKDELGHTHYRLQQTLNGFPIANSMLVVHVKGGQVIAANGEWFKELPVYAKAAALSKEACLQKALQKVNARKYIWETQEAELVRAGKIEGDEHINYNRPDGELVYISSGNELNAKKLTLTYRYDISTVEPVVRQLVYVDASTGSVVFAEDKICHANTPGTANTGYYGAKSVTLDQVGSTYYTRQTGTRNIELIDKSRNAVISSTTSTISGTGNAKYYPDVYWGAEVTVDFYKAKFNRNSYNGAGGKLTLHVNDASVNNNAYWNGTYATFGNASSGTPFTSLDVVAHEITHGVTGTSARLTYQNESGALNEGFSDIFGSYADYYAGVGQQWIMGEFISFQRSMSNPNQFRQPDTYKGTYWTTGTSDNGGVHTNSGVINYWFYLTSQGGTGTNDLGNKFTVTGIGVEKAAQIAYRALTTYLTSSSGYTAARTAVINAARDLYGVNSCEEAAATNAMYAVGVGAQFTGNCNSSNTCAALTGLTSSQISSTTAAIKWDAVTGVSAYTVEYKSSSTGAYTIITATTNSTTLTGLTPDTQYDVRVRYTCTNGITADYVSTVFKTLPPPVCNGVTGLSVTGISSTSALVSWNAVSGINTYTVEYKPSTGGSYTVLTANSRSTTLTNLTPGTQYDVRVRYTCTNGVTADYVSTVFTTLPDNPGCNVITGLSVTGITTTSALVSWNAVSGISTYTLEYKPSSASTYTTVYANTNSSTLTGLTAGTQYDVRVTYTCTNGTTADYTSSVFTTLPDNPCNAITGLSVTGITSTSALVSWNAVSGVSTYTLEYKPSAGTTYTTVYANTNSSTLTGLTAGTQYDVRVTYTCANGNTADYVTTTFTTQSAQVCSAPTGVTASSITATTVTISWNAVSGASSYNVEVIVSGTTYPFTTSNTTISFTGLTANTSYEVRVSAKCSNGQTSDFGSTTFQTTSGNTGCGGVAPYQSGKIYMQGERMTYQGYVWEAATNYVYWTPQYGWWINRGACTGASANAAFGAFAADPVAVNTTEDMGNDLYPNPAKDRVTVKVNNYDEAKQDKVVLFNALGNVVYEQAVELSNGINTIDVHFGDVQKGVYTLKINGTSRRIVIVE